MFVEFLKGFLFPLVLNGEFHVIWSHAGFICPGVEISFLIQWSFVYGAKSTGKFNILREKCPCGNNVLMSNVLWTVHLNYSLPKNTPYKNCWEWGLWITQNSRDTKGKGVNMFSQFGWTDPLKLHWGYPDTSLFEDGNSRKWGVEGPGLLFSFHPHSTKHPTWFPYTVKV